jgi:hypothetical protein
MNWNEIIERNAERLVAVLTELFVMAGFGRGGTAFLPRSVCRALLILMRPAESAARRLIIMAARGLVVKLQAPSASHAFPAGMALNRDEDRVLAFCLIDPLKRFAPEGFEWSKEWGKEGCAVQVVPRISVPGLFDPVFIPPQLLASEDDLISPKAIRLRLLALKAALDHLPRHARRLARWKARGELASKAEKWKPSRMSPFRPGLAPGFHRTNTREIDEILTDCHYFARQAWDRPDTS